MASANWAWAKADAACSGSCADKKKEKQVAVTQHEKSSGFFLRPDQEAKVPNSESTLYLLIWSLSGSQVRPRRSGSSLVGSISDKLPIRIFDVNLAPGRLQRPPPVQSYRDRASRPSLQRIAEANADEVKSPRYRGVKKQPWGRYTAEISEPDVERWLWLGTFDTAEQAARAYDDAIRQLRGSDAKTNFPYSSAQPPTSATTMGGLLHRPAWCGRYPTYSESSSVVDLTDLTVDSGFSHARDRVPRLKLPHGLPLAAATATASSNRSTVESFGSSSPGPPETKRTLPLTSAAAITGITVDSLSSDTQVQPRTMPGAIRQLLQLLTHVRTTILLPNGGSPSDAWFSTVELTMVGVQDCLQALYYEMILTKLGIRGDHKKVMSNVSESSPESSFGTPYAVEIQILSIVHNLDAFIQRGQELSASAVQSCSRMLALGHSVRHCILICRSILCILTVIGDKHKKEAEQHPVFAFDDLTAPGQYRASWLNAHSIPTHVSNPVYLFSSAVSRLLYLDLSGCSSLAQLPASIDTIGNLNALNLSCCYSLQTLPTSLGSLKNLHILVLSFCKKLQSLPVSLYELSKLRLLDLSGCSTLEILAGHLMSLSHLEHLNLSDCKRLKDLPQSFDTLQELKYLNLSGCHAVDLDAEHLYQLVNLKCLTLSPHTDIKGFPDSFHDLAIHLEMIKWWKKNRVHPHCNPNDTSLQSYRCHQQCIIDRLLYCASNEGETTSDQRFISICIVGESGMGKTVLVHRICDDPVILDTFNLRIWIPEFTACDKKRLFVKIIEFTTCTYCSDAPMSVLEDIVMEELTGKRLLLVLDDSDIENKNIWSVVRKILNACAIGSALIVTTQNKEVANQVSAMQNYFLSSLSKEECFMIFQEHVFGGLDMNYYPHLENVGWKIVEKCGGNALCMKALSGLLCHSEIGLSEIYMLADGILPALRLCYDLLPAHLQKCFRFCSLFPKDYTFVKNHIVRLWMAQGFVIPEEGIQPEETALQYFDELLCRSFFQRSPVSNNQEDYFIMHELFHDLAESVSKGECLRSEEPFCSLPENISHLSLVLSDIKTIVLNKEVKNLMSFLVVRRSFPVVRILHSNDLYVKYEFLRALNLSCTDILQLPSSIGNMKHLAFLALNNTMIMELPFQIGQVGTLQTLELQDCCHLTELPRSIRNLSKLRHLDVRKKQGDTKVGMPHGMGELTDLQTLSVFNIGNDLLHCSIKELVNLSGLRGHVYITGLENVKTADDAREANMMGKLFIETLTLEWCYDNEIMDDDLGKAISNDVLQSLQPNSNLKELAIRNYYGNLFPVWVQNPYLDRLVSVTFDNCHECSDLPYLGDLPSLKYLFIQRMNYVGSFGFHSNSSAAERKHSPGFPSLEELTLWEMYNLQFWVGTCEGDFPLLRHLYISRCPKLMNLPPLGSLVHLSFHCGGQVPSFSELPSIERLKIEGFHKITSISFPHHVTNLKKLEIINCKELLSMYAYSLSVLDLQVVGCLKLDLVGNSLEDQPLLQIVGSRSSLTRRSMVLKTVAYNDISNDGWKWNIHCKIDIFGSTGSRTYYRCINRSSTGCNATKLLQHDDIDLNTLSIMYIYEHNHECPIDLHLGLSTKRETTRKRKEHDVSCIENTSKRQLNESSQL